MRSSRVKALKSDFLLTFEPLRNLGLSIFNSVKKYAVLYCSLTVLTLESYRRKEDRSFTSGLGYFEAASTSLWVKKLMRFARN